MSGIMRNSVEWERIRLFALLLHLQSSSSVIITKVMKRQCRTRWPLDHTSSSVPVITILQSTIRPAKSTMSNSIDPVQFSIVELHRRLSVPVRNPSSSTVELHRRVTEVRQEVEHHFRIRFPFKMSETRRSTMWRSSTLGPRCLSEVNAVELQLA